MSLGVFRLGSGSEAKSAMRVLFFRRVVKVDYVYDNRHSVREFLPNDPLEMSSTEHAPRFDRE